MQSKIHGAVSSKLISKNDISEDVDIDTKSLDVLLNSEDGVIECNGHVCNKIYHEALTDAVLDLIERAIANIT